MPLHGVRLRIAVADEDAEQHPRDVGVEYGGTLSEREAEDGARGVRADALERQERLLVRGESPAIPRHRLARDGMQAARPDVVAERPPRRGDVVLIGPRERFQRGIL